MTWEEAEIRSVLACFGLDFEKVTNFFDTSHSETDVRLCYILDERYVLKIQSPDVMSESRLREISRLIERCQRIGVYAPNLIPAADGQFSQMWVHHGRELICFVEVCAPFQVCGDRLALDRREVVKHLGILAKEYSGIDLQETRSMWSIIDLAPLDTDVDEKQENVDILASALSENGYAGLSKQLEQYNEFLRQEIQKTFRELPRCVYQGNLNFSNVLQCEGHFAGLIDFNMSGTDVNINVFLNETNWFPGEDEFDRMEIAEILKNMDCIQKSYLEEIWVYYTPSDEEKRLIPYFKQIVDLFQYPNVCAMVKWLKEASRREKCAMLIEEMMKRTMKYQE